MQRRKFIQCLAIAPLAPILACPYIKASSGPVSFQDFEQAILKDISEAYGMPRLALIKGGQYSASAQEVDDFRKWLYKSRKKMFHVKLLEG